MDCRVALAEVLKSAICPRNEILVAEGDVGDAMYFLIHGFVDVSKVIDGTSKQEACEPAGPHSFFIQTRGVLGPVFLSDKSIGQVSPRLPDVPFGIPFGPESFVLQRVIRDVLLYLVTLSKGAFFGEVALLTTNSVRTASIESVTFSEVLILIACVKHPNRGNGTHSSQSPDRRDRMLHAYLRA
eukprot:gene16526-biopygen2476